MPKPKLRKATATDQVFAGGRWTKARYIRFVQSALRKAWMKWPPKFDALGAASRPSQLVDKRTKTEYLCTTCQKWFKKKDVEVHHIVACGSPEDLNVLVAHMLCEEDGLQVECRGCHRIKTQLERETRKKT